MNTNIEPKQEESNNITEKQGRLIDPDYIQPKVEMEEKKMATLKEAAQAYQPPQTLNIADLDNIPIDIELKDGSGIGTDGETFTYKYTEIEGRKYRVAGSIIGGIKALLDKIPELKFVQVIKQGQGMNTRYQVIPSSESTAPITKEEAIAPTPPSAPTAPISTEEAIAPTPPQQPPKQ